MNERIRVIARLTAHVGREDELRSLLHALVAPTRVENGCLRYELWEQADAPGTFVFVEEWASEAHLEAHLGATHVSEAIAGVSGLGVGPELSRYRVIA
jgi:quinol monooxygenase YgiN